MENDEGHIQPYARVHMGLGACGPQPGLSTDQIDAEWP